MAKDNKELGRFQLIGIPPAPRGVPQVEVTFDIDANGIVHVTAKDLGTGKEQSIKIVASEKLSKEEIEKMKKEAEEHATEDKKLKEEAEALNQGEATVYASEKMLSDLADKIPEESKKKIAEKTETLKNALKDKNVSSVKEAMDSLNKEMQAFSAELYKKAQEAQKPAPGTQEKPKKEKKEKKKPSGDKVVDADFKMEDEDKK